MSFFKKIFSIENSGVHTVCMILGLKISFTFLKKYLYCIKDREKYDNLQGEMNKNIPLNTQVWTCWLQGEENVPEIVNICLNRIKKYYPDTVIITEDNLNDYITLPDYIWGKYKNGNITPTHFSDIIRACLLDKYGGIWIDATCFLTQYIPEFIFKQDIFLFPSTNKRNISSWFIKSVKDNYVIKSVKTFLFDYWKENNSLAHYFLFHEFICMARKKDKEFSDYWDKNVKICIYTNTNFLFMRYYIKKYAFDKDCFKWLCQHTFIHKLTYKVSSESFSHRDIFDNEKQLEDCVNFLKNN